MATRLRRVQPGSLARSINEAKQFQENNRFWVDMIRENLGSSDSPSEGTSEGAPHLRLAGTSRD